MTVLIVGHTALCISLFETIHAQESSPKMLTEFHLHRVQAQWQPLSYLRTTRSVMLHELAIGLAKRVRSLKDLEVDDLAVIY